ncbi:hypothetical protein B0H14DRAFT_2893254 [Mycena olivaceomarginata]|nr:hypothetical protein B0H14DRAFT_2893254 [Mycena olivaceomarginata]
MAQQIHKDMVPRHGGSFDPFFRETISPNVNFFQQQHWLHQSHTLISSHQYESPTDPPSSPPHVPFSIPPSPLPPAPDMFYLLSPSLSGDDTSADGLHHSDSSGANSPSSSPTNSFAQRQVRYNLTPSPTSPLDRHGRGRSPDSADEEMDLLYAEAQNRKEAMRRQRIEAEQRRRDELRDRYAKLKDVLPISTQKGTLFVELPPTAEVILLFICMATSHIAAPRDRIAILEETTRRLHTIKEKLSGGSFEVPSLAPPLRTGPIPTPSEGGF